MKNLLKRIFNKPQRMSQEDLLRKFDVVIDEFNGTEENLLTKETMLLNFQGNARKRIVKTHFGEKELIKINWKSMVRKQEIEALNHENKDLFLALENYLISSLQDYGLTIRRIQNGIDGEFFNIEVDFKQKYRNDDFFNDLKELSQKVEELSGSIKLYKSKKKESGVWKLILSIDKRIKPAQKQAPAPRLEGEA